MDIASGEQFSSWFLQLNPKGDVPVLKDNELVICNSNSIIEYLESKYNGGWLLTSIFIFCLYFPCIFLGNYIRLRHFDPLCNMKMEKMFDRLNVLPIGALSLGSFIHEDLKLSPKPPFVGPAARQSCLSKPNFIS